MLFWRTGLFSIHGGIFLKSESEQVFSEGWMVHEHVGGESCSTLQQELGYILTTCNTKHTTQSQTMTMIVFLLIYTWRCENIFFDCCHTKQIAQK